MSIAYIDTKRGDILRIVGKGARGFAENGELVRVIKVMHNGVEVENKHGKTAEFLYNCGADRLEATEWKSDFPLVDVVKHPEVEAREQMQDLAAGSSGNRLEGSPVVPNPDMRIDTNPDISIDTGAYGGPRGFIGGNSTRVVPQRLPNAGGPPDIAGDFVKE